MTKIYLITNLINGKQYVGKTKYSLAHRFSQHCNNDYYNTYIHNAIKKYGKENFKIEEICRCDDNHWEELEKFYINFYHTHYLDGGYNISLGGDYNPMNDELTRRKHKNIMCSSKQRKIDSDNIRKYNKSEIRKQHDKETSERQKGIYLDQFKIYNSSRKISVGMIKDGKLVKKFNSATDACKYLGKPIKEAGNILKRCDVINKFGRPAKMFGYNWTRL